MTTEPLPSQTTAAALQQRITDEIFFALGLNKNGALRKWFGGLFDLPTRRFAQIFAEADAASIQGLCAAGRRILPAFSIHIDAHGAESLPKEGPLLIVSNHPGAYDSVCISSCVPRPDLKIIVWSVPFYRALENANRWLIHVPEDINGKMLALRQGIEHLQEGGSLLLFGTGHIDPDPAVAPGAGEHLAHWSKSIEIMLRKAPATQLVTAIASGILQPAFAHHLLTRLRKDAHDRRRLSEFMQVIYQLVYPERVRPHIRLSFDEPVTAAELQVETQEERLMTAIYRRALSLLEEHVGRFGGSAA